MDRLAPEPVSFVGRDLLERQVEDLGQCLARQGPDLVHRDGPVELAGDRREGRVFETTGGDPVGKRCGVEVDVQRVAVRRDPA